MKLELNREVYKLKYIRKAIKEFSGIADIKQEKIGDYYEVEIDNVQKGYTEVMPGEFLNFLVYLSKNG